MSTASTLTSWALLIWRALEQQGVNPKTVFDSCGLDPSMLGDTNARYPIDKMQSLWATSVQVTGDEEFGVEVGRNWRPTTFNALGFVWLASDSLHNALRKAVRYAHIVNNALVTKVEREGPHYRYTLALHSDEDAATNHPASSDAGISSLIIMCRLLMGDEFSPVSVSVRHPYRPPGKLAAFVGAQVDYDANRTSILFDGTTIHKRLPSGNKNLESLNERIIVEYLQWLDKTDVASAVKSKLFESLPSGKVNEQMVAESLNMNVRTLQRKLAKQDESFKDLLNSVRLQMVKSYINNSRLSLTEIAYMLGFSDQANFTRAFKRWFGVPPRQYRKDQATEAMA